MTIKEIYTKSKYHVSSHGPITVNFLKEAFENIDPNLPADAYGKGDIIENFEKKISSYFGMEKGVFFPSGGMAQQIALRMNAEEKQCFNVVYHKLAHIEARENNPLPTLHGIIPIIVGEEDKVFTLEDLKKIKEPYSTLLIELPQRDLGGQVPEYDELCKIIDYAHKQGAYVHLDGARLLEVTPYYNKDAKEIANLFDSVYVSFYKGIGSVAGAMLMGKEKFIEDSKIWKRRMGGDIYALYPYIIPADYYFDKRAEGIKRFYKQAKDLAAFFNSLDYCTTLPQKIVSNMFHLYINLPEEKIEKIATEIYEKYDVALFRFLVRIDDNHWKTEFSICEKYELIPETTVDGIKKILKNIK